MRLISNNQTVQKIGTPKAQVKEASSTLGHISKSTGTQGTQDHTEHVSQTPTEVGYERCAKCCVAFDLLELSKDWAVEDELAKEDNAIVVFLREQGFKEWMNIVLLEHQRKVWRYHRASNSDGHRLGFENMELKGGGRSGYLSIDRPENLVFRIRAELVRSANYGTRSRVHHALCNGLEGSIGQLGLFSESDTKFIPGFTALGPIHTPRGGILKPTIGRQPAQILFRSRTPRAEVILKHVLNQLVRSRCGLNGTIKITIHVGVEAVSGYFLEELQAISKAIVLFGGLRNAIGLNPNRGYHECCLYHNKRALSNSKHIHAIDIARSIRHVARLMHSLEASGYTSWRTRQSEPTL
ncbi:hypothetical protein HOY80DRAFT_774426 [Tuber brumale]|nr:hypothetical protein HOY80DRAFT_774426 [Tuber brumale]